MAAWDPRLSTQGFLIPRPRGKGKGPQLSWELEMMWVPWKVSLKLDPAFYPA